MSGAPSTSFMPVITSSGTLEEAFPDVDPNHEPFGSDVLLQIRVAKETTGNKIKRDDGTEVELVLPEEVRITIQANTQVAKIVAVGPLAFKNRNTGQQWPEGAWAGVGDFVKIPKYGGERWEVKHGDGVVMFVQFRDLDLKGRVPRPLDLVAYI
jgi:co-chaperonin GroES (HSP10)